MKRAQRHHLKENELVSMAMSVRQTFETTGPQAMTVLVVVAVLLALLAGYVGWRARLQGRAGALLAEALTVEGAYVGPPAEPGAPQPDQRYDTPRQRDEAALEKFKAVADQYPGTDAGLFARYREAGLQLLLGNPEAAASSYREVIEQEADGIYAQMARLGLADAQARAGQVEQAISTYKELSEATDGPLPVDGILMQLGRAYQRAGQTSDAEQTFQRLVDEFPTSPFSVEAERELEELRKT